MKFKSLLNKGVVNVTQLKPGQLFLTDGVIFMKASVPEDLEHEISERDQSTLSVILSIIDSPDPDEVDLDYKVGGFTTFALSKTAVIINAELVEVPVERSPSMGKS
jgi:2-methylaconitate cis-trans-isomerase PrpF